MSQSDTSQNPAGGVPSGASSPRPSGAGGHDWGTALIVACLVLGVVLAWGHYEVGQRRLAESDIRLYRHDLDALTSRDGDLGNLLADPDTKLVPLETADPREISPLHLAAIAWNDGHQRGALFCDNLAPAGDGREYQLWLIPREGDDAATAVSLSDPEPGQTVYAFSPMGRASPREFVLTVGPPVSLLSQAEAKLAHASLD
jgi:hypothetical protein